VASDLHVAVATALRRDRQRYTRGRRTIIEILGVAERPLTLPEILERDGDLAQSSVYRNLTVLERAGAVHRVVTSDEHARYELAEGFAEHHHHLICVACGSVEDFLTPPRIEQMLDRAMTEIGRETGFDPSHHRLDMVGICGDCA